MARWWHLLLVCSQTQLECWVFYIWLFLHISNPSVLFVFETSLIISVGNVTNNSEINLRKLFYLSLSRATRGRRSYTRRIFILKKEKRAINLVFVFYSSPLWFRLLLMTRKPGSDRKWSRSLLASRTRALICSVWLVNLYHIIADLSTTGIDIFYI
jgi:hypothetical protein